MCIQTRKRICGEREIEKDQDEGMNRDKKRKKGTKEEKERQINR